MEHELNEKVVSVRQIIVSRQVTILENRDVVDEIAPFKSFSYETLFSMANWWNENQNEWKR